MRFCRLVRDGEPHWGVIDAGVVSAVDGDVFGSWTRGAEVGDVEQVRMLAPVDKPRIFGMALNYHSALAERSMSASAHPMIFNKYAAGVVGPGQPVHAPPNDDRMIFEGELAVIIGRRCRGVQTAQVPSVIFGYTCANDVTIPSRPHWSEET